MTTSAHAIGEAYGFQSDSDSRRRRMMRRGEAAERRRVSIRFGFSAPPHDGSIIPAAPSSKFQSDSDSRRRRMFANGGVVTGPTLFQSDSDSRRRRMLRVFNISFTAFVEFQSDSDSRRRRMWAILSTRGTGERCFNPIRILGAAACWRLRSSSRRSTRFNPIRILGAAACGKAHPSNHSCSSFNPIRILGAAAWRARHGDMPRLRSFNPIRILGAAACLAHMGRDPHRRRFQSDSDSRRRRMWSVSTSTQPTGLVSIRFGFSAPPHAGRLVPGWLGPPGFNPIRILGAAACRSPRRPLPSPTGFNPIRILGAAACRQQEHSSSDHAVSIRFGFSAPPHDGEGVGGAAGAVVSIRFGFSAPPHARDIRYGRRGGRVSIRFGFSAPPHAHGIELETEAGEVQSDSDSRRRRMAEAEVKESTRRGFNPIRILGAAACFEDDRPLGDPRQFQSDSDSRRRRMLEETSETLTLTWVSIRFGFSAPPHAGVLFAALEARRVSIRFGFSAPPHVQRDVPIVLNQCVFQSDSDSRRRRMCSPVTWENWTPPVSIRFGFSAPPHEG